VRRNVQKRVVAPRPVIRQAFQNLLSNAIKYRQDKRPPEIHIRGYRQEGEWTFSVSDNGQGIPDEYRDRLFQWFSRVPGTKASGNGIGLASIERMLERVGGRIWMESEPGSGSTFHFTVPANQERVEC
jgi:two-component system, chemotaxis family, sensor kinase Cph1